VYDLDGNTQIRQLTFAGNNHSPIWTSDGERITFQSDRDGEPSIFWQAADGKGPAEPLIKAGRGETLTPESWSSDQDTLLFSARTGSRAFLLRIFTVHDKQNRPFAAVQSNSEPAAGFSPDGRWVTYTIESAGNDVGRVFVRPFPLTDEIHTVGPGVSPFWDRKRLSLYFVSRPGVGAFSTVNITTEPAFGVSQPTAVPRPVTAGGGPNLPRAYDVAPDGQHLVILTPPDTANSVSVGRQVQVVLNWFEELKALVPVK
jgi:hypothetical protein